MKNYLEEQTDIMGDSERITAVLVDTCSFRDVNSDFLGVSSMLLPSFFDVINEKRMLLLIHPVLEKEIEKHIEDSGLYKDYQKLVSQINRCRDVLIYADCNNEDLFNKIMKYDIKNETYKAYERCYKDAVRLGFPDPEIIFSQYFSSKPPFALTGKKKTEFPDAFVIEATKQYLSEHPNEVLLVVSKDGDWVKSFEDVEQSIVCESIDEAMKKISSIESILSFDMLYEIFLGAHQEIISQSNHRATYECFELDDYEFIEDMVIDSVETYEVSDLFIPLQISRNMILIKTDVTLKVSGHGYIFDEERSIWDGEDEKYIYKGYSNIEFVNGDAELECEVRIRFDFDNPGNSAEVSSFKFITRGNIMVTSKEIKLIPIDDEDMTFRGL